MIAKQATWSFFALPTLAIGQLWRHSEPCPRVDRGIPLLIVRNIRYSASILPVAQNVRIVLS